MKHNGYRLVSGGTDNHLMLVDVGAKNLTGKDCQIALDEAGITVNKNTIPASRRARRFRPAEFVWARPPSRRAA